MKKPEITRFTYEIDIHEETEHLSEVKMKALIVFAKKFKAKELEKFAEVAEKDPSKVAMLKSYLGIAA